MRLIDLSHEITSGMITYKGLPAPIVCDHLSREQSRQVYSPGTEFQIGRIEMVGNTGTYIDVPFHRFAHGHDLGGLALARVSAVPATVVNATQRDGRAIDWQRFEGCDCRHRAVLVRTGWDRLWGSDGYFEGHPFLTQAAAEFLRDQRVSLVGIDSYNIDDTRTGSRPVHTVLLAENIPIVEHLRGLEQLPVSGFRFSAVPPRIVGMGTFPVRAHALID